MEKEQISQPSLCSHKRNKVGGNKQTCLRCGRVRVKEKNRICFYWKDGQHYFTLPIKKGRLRSFL